MQNTNNNFQVKVFFDDDSHTFSYLVWDANTKKSAIIDSVLDYNHKNVTSDTKLADEIIRYIKENHLQNEWILETHMHADHISASTYLQQQVGGKKAIGSKVIGVQKYLKEVFNLNDNFKTDGSQFDHLFEDGEGFAIGNLKAKTMHGPGHTPADMVYIIEGNIFSGDTILAPDIGTARCDFPGGSAETLYKSVRKILETFPPKTKIYLCHDYPEGKNREAMYLTTVGEQRENNVQIKDGISMDEYVKFRSARDKTLDLPTYIFPSVQINGNGGSLTEGEFIKLSYNKKVL
jgi:glyoxylase-like metal-dependent hydrolase (beta-lactamase superfamily II)